MQVVAGDTISVLAVRIARARADAGIREHGGRNRGTEVDAYARGVGLDPAGGFPWCTSGLYDVFREAAALLGSPNPFPKTAKAVHVWEALFRMCYEPNPRPGLVYVLDHGPPGNLLTEWKNDRYTDDGHIGIVESLDALGAVFEEVSGNTNAMGSREGDRWAVHHGTPEVSHGGVLLGYLDLERAPR